MKETLKLEISQNAILIDQQPIVKLNNFEFAAAGAIPEPTQSGALYRTLSEQRKKLPNPNVDPNLLILADENTPYSTVKRVLAAAANSGFVDLQLVVIQGQ